MRQLGIIGIGGLFLVGGCEGSSYTAPGGTTLVCPNGGEPAAAAEMSVFLLSVDGTVLLAGFEPTGTYNEVSVDATVVEDSGDTGTPTSSSTSTTQAEPAACVNSSTNSVSWIFEVAGEGFGRLTVETGSVQGGLDPTVPGTVTLDFFGYVDPFVVGSTEVTLGSVYVNSLSPSISVDVDLEALTDEAHTAAFVSTAEATP